MIAYEPVWAIGTGKTATQGASRRGSRFHPQIAWENVRLGSRRANSNSVRRQRQTGNAAELLAQPNIDGALVGGASLKVEDFVGIIKS